MFIYFFICLYIDYYYKKKQFKVQKNDKNISSEINQPIDQNTNLPMITEKEKKKKKKKKLASDTNSGMSISQDDHALDQVTLQKRCILHNRVEKFCELRYNKLKNQFESLETPGKFIHYDIFWLENFLDCFIECEDWSWLMRCGQQFRSKAGVKS